jgi:hypothetical protein
LLPPFDASPDATRTLSAILLGVVVTGDIVEKLLV